MQYCKHWQNFEMFVKASQLKHYLIFAGKGPKIGYNWLVSTLAMPKSNIWKQSP
jgi:hypothetical protein